MARNDRTVWRRVDGMWAVTVDGVHPTASVHRTQAEAIREARRDLYRCGGGELKIKGMNGKIRAKDTIGKKDPFPARG